MNLTPAEQELWDDLWNSMGEPRTSNQRSAIADRLLTKSRECYLSIRLEQDTEVLKAEQAAVDLLKKERDEARAECAEMRKVVELAASHDHADGDETDCTLCQAVKYALSMDCGKGWHSPEEWEKSQSEIKRLEECKALLRETEYFHLRYEENREWLERRDRVLKC